MQPNILEGVVTGDGSFKSYTIFYLYYECILVELILINKFNCRFL